MNLHQIVLGEDGEPGATDYEWRNCTIHLQINGIRIDSTAGAAWTANNVISNCIYGGLQTESGVIFNNAVSNDGLPNILWSGTTASGITGDTTSVDTYDAEGNCTNLSQGYRKSVTFPWSIADVT